MGNQVSTGSGGKSRLAAAEQELRDKDATIAEKEKEYQKQLDTAREDAANANGDLRVLRSKVDSLNSQLAQLQLEKTDTVERLQAELRDNKNAFESQRLALERVSQSVTQERDRGRIELRHVREKINSLQQHSETLENELDTAKRDLNHAVDERSTSEQKMIERLASLQRQLGESEKEQNKLRDSHSKLAGELAHLKDESDKSIALARNDLAEACTQFTTLQDSSISAAQASEQKYSAIKQEVDESAERYNQLRMLHDQLQKDSTEKLNSGQKELTNTQKRLNDLQSAHDHLRLAAQKDGSIAEDLVRSEDRVAALEAERDEVKTSSAKALSKARADLDSLRVDLASKISSHSKLFEELSALKLHLIENNEHAKVLEMKHASEVNKYKEEIESLTKTGASADGATKTMKQEHAVGLNKVKKLADEASAKVKTIENEALQLKQQREDSTLQLSKIEEQRNDVLNQAKQAEEDLKAAEQENVSLSTRIRELQPQNGSSESDLTSKLREAKGNLSEVRTDNENLTTSSRQLPETQEKLQSIEKEKADLLKHVEELDSKLKSVLEKPIQELKTAMEETTLEVTAAA